MGAGTSGNGQAGAEEDGDAADKSYVDSVMGVLGLNDDTAPKCKSNENYERFLPLSGVAKVSGCDKTMKVGDQCVLRCKSGFAPSGQVSVTLGNKGTPVEGQSQDELWPDPPTSWKDGGKGERKKTLQSVNEAIYECKDA